MRSYSYNAYGAECDLFGLNVLHLSISHICHEKPEFDELDGDSVDDFKCLFSQLWDQ